MDLSHLNKAQKLVKIVELMSRRGGVRASELGDRFDMDARTLRRYLADLRELGIPLSDEGRAEDRLLTIDAQWRRTGVHLSLAEVLSLHFGRTLFNFLDGTHFAEDLNGAIERLQPAISQAHADLARQLDTKFVAVPEPRKHWTPAASEVIDDAITALVYDNPIEARYRKVGGVERQYLLHPYTLASFRNGLYLFALDVEAGRVKTFALERFTDMVRKRERFEPPVGWSPHAHIVHAFGIIGAGDVAEVRLAFDERVVGYIRERTWHPTQTFGTLPDGRLELRMKVTVGVELVTWILSHGADVEVLHPASLRRRVAEDMRKALERYA